MYPDNLLEFEDFELFKHRIQCALYGIKELARFLSSEDFASLGVIKEQLEEMCHFDPQPLSNEEEFVLNYIYPGAAIIKTYCLLAHVYYERKTFTPFCQLLGEFNLLADAEYDVSLWENAAIRLTKRELFTGLRILDDISRRTILQNLEEQFDMTYDSVMQNDYNGFCRGIIDCENLNIISVEVLFEILRTSITNKYPLKTEGKQSLLNDSNFENAVAEFLPSTEKYVYILDNLTINTDVERLVPLSLEFYEVLQEYFSERAAIINFVLYTCNVGKRIEKRIIQLQDQSRFLIHNTTAIFDPDAVCQKIVVNSLLPIFTKIGLNLIRARMDEKELLVEYEESDIGKRFLDFIN
ncbi:MAG: hypothetical protein J1E97_02915 [Muribaculaceae bacterium]|nr:hypothetical protein [Muribaculaceae bacterium]